MSEPSKVSLFWGSNDIQGNNTNVDNDVIESTNNHIYFYAKINKENICKLNKLIYIVSEDLKKINNTYETHIIIYLHLNTTGGSIFAAISSMDKIMSSKIDIYTIIEGCCASAGTLISLAGKKRFITPHSYMLIHQLSSSLWGKFNEIEDEFENLQNLMKLIKNIYQEQCHLPKSGKNSLNNILKHDIWWDAKKCLEYKMVDEIYQ